MGDTAFFNAVRTFGLNHAHSTAVTDDLKVLLETEYGGSLDEFFDQWLYTPYRPVYSVMYENATRPGGYKVAIILEQTQGHAVQDVSGNPVRDYYSMPIDFTIHYTDATTENFTVSNTQRLQTFQLETTKEPVFTVLDEQYNILRIVEELPSDDDGIPGDGDNSGVLGDNTCVGGEVEDCDDNCHNLYNPAQEDTSPPDGNGIGDACECEGNFDCDEDCDGSDAGTFKVDFGRNDFFNPCTNGLPCNGDFDCDNDCDGTDAAKFKEDFGRSLFSNPCPICTVADWCSYPDE